MKVTLYITYENYDDGDFDMRNDYYASDDDYFNAVKAEVDKYSNVAYDVVSNLGNVVQNNTAKFSTSPNKTRNNEKEFKAENVTLFVDESVEETVDNLISTCVSQDVAVYRFNFDPDNIESEFEEDYLNWIGEHNNMNKYVDKLGEDKVWESQPTRTFKVEFVNNANETKYVEFERCKIYEVDKNNVYSCIVVAEKINFI